MFSDLVHDAIFFKTSDSGRIRDCSKSFRDDGTPVDTIDCPQFPATLLLDDLEGLSVKMRFSDAGYLYSIECYPDSHHTGLS